VAILSGWRDPPDKIYPIFVGNDFNKCNRKKEKGKAINPG
jgi:hypothetical protein